MMSRMREKNKPVAMLYVTKRGPVCVDSKPPVGGAGTGVGAGCNTRTHETIWLDQAIGCVPKVNRSPTPSAKSARIFYEFEPFRSDLSLSAAFELYMLV